MPDIKYKEEALVYRVENKEGEGPYVGIGATTGKPHWQSWAECKHDSSSSRPTPFETKLYEHITQSGLDMKRFVFGFTSLEQLNNWFSENELAKLAEYGYHVYSLFGKTVYDDGYQCVFIRS